MRWIEGWPRVALWLIKYSQEAGNYFDDNGMLVADLYQSIKVLARNDGYPAGPYTELARIEILFEANGHTVIYEQWQTQQMVRVVMVKPD